MTSLLHTPRSTAIALALFTCLALFGASRVTTDPSHDRLLLQHHETYRVYQRFRTTFGSDETILAVLHHPEVSLLQPQGLTAIRDLTQDLAAHPHVSAVTSLTTVPNLDRLQVTPFGLTAPPLIEGIQVTSAHLAAIRANRTIVGPLLSADLRTAGILVTPAYSRHSPTSTFDERQAWLSDLRTIVTSHARHGRQTYIAGPPLESYDVYHYLQRDQHIAIPLVMIILLAITYSLYRQLRLALVPMGCVALTLAWTMGLVGFMGRPLNVITSLLPPVLMVVSVSATIHLLNAFLAARANHIPHRAAIVHAIRDITPACGLTTLTTMLGFFSLLVSPVPAVRDFALLAGLGVGLAFVITLTGAPLALLTVGSHSTRLAKAQGPIERLIEQNLHWILGYRYRAYISGHARRHPARPTRPLAPDGRDRYCTRPQSQCAAAGEYRVH